MELDETARFELHETLREVLGEARGDTLMSMLPPVEWSDVATKPDVAALEKRVDDRFAALEKRVDERFAALEERVEHRLAALEERLTAAFHREMNRQIWAMAGTLIGLAAVLTANNVL